jgi:hypothetical protein
MLEFQHFIPRFNQKLPYFAGPHSKRGLGVKKRPKEDKVATYIFTAPTRTTTIITWNLVH